MRAHRAIRSRTAATAGDRVGDVQRGHPRVRVCFAQVGDDDAITAGGEPPRGGPADAVGGAGDDRDPGHRAPPGLRQLIARVYVARSK
jgi:hypothetical protein